MILCKAHISETELKPVKYKSETSNTNFLNVCDHRPNANAGRWLATASVLSQKCLEHKIKQYRSLLSSEEVVVFTSMSVLKPTVSGIHMNTMTLLPPVPFLNSKAIGSPMNAISFSV